MTRSRLWLVLLLMAAAGFAAGRYVAPRGAADARRSDADSGNFPAPPRESPDAVPAADSSDVIVEMPVDGATIAATFLDVAGRARRAGGPLTVTLKDASGAALATAEMPVDGLETDEFGRFALTLTFDAPGSEEGTVEFARGTTAPPLVRQVRFGVAAVPTEGQEFKAYFHNGELGPADDCSLVFPVERNAPTGAAAALLKPALEALLAGPTASERTSGYTTALPDGVALKSVSFDRGTVTADFAGSLERGVAGSCRVGAIRAQIETTLRQFPDVRDVIISVDGRIDDALQP